MPLQNEHPRNLELALDSQVCVRIIPSHSSHWKPPPENRATSGAFDDEKGEVSIDLFESCPKSDELQKKYAEKIQSNGIGLACAVTKNVRESLLAKQILGNVWKDPINGNEIHGIISGEQNKKKKNALRDTFSVEVSPKSPQEVFGKISPVEDSTLLS